MLGDFYLYGPIKGRVVVTFQFTWFICIAIICSVW